MEVTIDIFRKLWRRALYLGTRYQSDRCRDTAAALTYMSLFALVPLLTVLYTMASAVPAFQGLESRIQELLFDNLVPETSAGIEEYVSDFSRQAKNLTGFGIAFLIATAVLMLRNIEQAFNLIWRTRGNRETVSSFLLYWAILSLAPITIGLGLGVSTFLASFAGQLEQWDIIGIGALLLRIMPYLLQVLGFTLVYAAVPNCRVPVKHAIVGGIIAATSFNIARALFTKLVAGSSITFIYGAFAAVPLFLLWIYISWIIVLVSAIVVHSLSAYQSEAQARRPLLLKGLEILETLWRRQAQGFPLKELNLLKGRKLTVDAESWQELRDCFLKHRVIAQDERGHYLLARDLHSVPLWQLQQWLDTEGEFSIQSKDSMPSWEQRAITLLDEQQQGIREHMNIPLATLFEY
ncbi:MAG: membrane protein [Glaciecola sp.]|jgi:membrane protein|uniref:YihY family inner membrane protein n=1 Tax=Congregibacter sp. TaxID=2744308 RepID=UPI0039E64F8B